MKPVKLKYAEEKALCLGMDGMITRSIVYGWQEAYCSIHGHMCPSVTYSSSNTKVVNVDENGFLFAAGKGKATITAKAHGVRAKHKVTVVAPKISLSFDEWVDDHNAEEKDNLSIAVDDEAIAKCEIEGPVYGETESRWLGYDDNVKCVSSDPDVASAKWDRLGGELIVTGKSPGSATITLSAYQGSVSVKVYVTEEDVLGAQGVKLSNAICAINWRWR